MMLTRAAAALSGGLLLASFAVPALAGGPIPTPTATSVNRSTVDVQQRDGNTTRRLVNGTPAPTSTPTPGSQERSATVFASNPTGGCELQVTGGSTVPAHLFVNGVVSHSIAPTPPAPPFQYMVNQDNGVRDGANTVEVRADDNGEVLATYVMTAQCDDPEPTPTPTPAPTIPGTGDAELDRATADFIAAVRAYVQRTIAQATATPAAG